MKKDVSPPPDSSKHPEGKRVPCRYCGAPATTVIDRRGDRVLRHCDACKLSWTAEEPP